MKLHKKAIGILVSVLILISSIAVAAQQEQPQTAFSVEPRRTDDGIEYSLYIEKSKFLSTLLFEMSFDGENIGSAELENNECFDILHTEWNSSNISVKGYLGRSGYKEGFASDDKIKVAKITLPLSKSSTGEFTANILNVMCAGIADVDGNAAKGYVNISEASIKYVVKECSILDFGQDEINLISAKNQNVDVIFAAYDGNGKLINIHKENVTLHQGKNTLFVSGIDFDKCKSASVMIWDGVVSMHPLADKKILNN